MSGKRMAAAAAGLVVLLGAGAVRAEFITYYFGGQITSLSDPGGAWEGRLQVGDPFTGAYVIDADTPDLDPSSSGYYVSASADMRINLGGTEIVSPASDSEITVWNTNSGSTYWDGIDFSSATYHFGDWWVEELFAFVRDRSCTQFGSDALPRESFDIGPFDSRPFGFAGNHGLPQGFNVRGVVTYLIIPEPATAGLTLLAVLAWLGRRDAARVSVRKA